MVAIDGLLALISCWLIIGGAGWLWGGLAGAIALSVMLLGVALGVLVVFRLVSNRETWQA